MSESKPLLDKIDVQARLRRAIAAEGSARAFCRKHGIRESGLSMVGHEHRKPSDAILAALKLAKVERYVDVGDAGGE